MILMAALLAGLPVARQATHGDLANRLRDGVRASSSRGERRYGNMLITSQVCLSVVLLFAAGLLIRSFWNLTHVDLGFEPRGVLTFWLTPSSSSRPPTCSFVNWRRRSAQCQEFRTWQRHTTYLRPGVRSVRPCFA
jgi:hypothetical protein